MEEVILAGIIILGLGIALFNRDETIVPLVGLVGLVSFGFIVARYTRPEVFLLMALPAGFILRFIAFDELRTGKRFFQILAIVSLGGLFFWNAERSFALTSLFVGIVSGISLIDNTTRKKRRYMKSKL